MSEQQRCNRKTSFSTLLLWFVMNDHGHKTCNMNTNFSILSPWFMSNDCGHDATTGHKNAQFKLFKTSKLIYSPSLFPFILVVHLSLCIHTITCVFISAIQDLEVLIFS